MSYVSGGLPYVNMGGAAVRSGVGVTAVTMVVTGTTASRSLAIATVYSTVDPFLMKDAGAGWKLLDGFYDAANAFGMSLWGVVPSRLASTIAGLAMPSGSFLSRTQTYEPLPPFCFDLNRSVPGGNSYSGVADSREMYWNPYCGAGAAQSFAQGISLLAGGCTNNGSVLPTGTAPTNYTERGDTGVTAAPSMNVYLMDRTEMGQGINDLYSQIGSTTFWSATSSKTKRATVRAFVPVIGNVAAYRGRYLSGRRVGG